MLRDPITPRCTTMGHLPAARVLPPSGFSAGGKRAGFRNSLLFSGGFVSGSGGVAL